MRKPLSGYNTWPRPLSLEAARGTMVRNGLYSQDNRASQRINGELSVETLTAPDVS